MSPDKVPDLLEVITWITVIAFVVVVFRGALAPMQDSPEADTWKRWLMGLLAVSIVELIGCLLFYLL